MSGLVFVVQWVAIAGVAGWALNWVSNLWR